MKIKLLNFLKNLIVILGLVAIVTTLFLATSSYAVSDPSSSYSSETGKGTGTTAISLGKLLRTSVSDGYRFVRRLSLAIFAIAYLLLIIKSLANRTPEQRKTAKESIIKFLVMYAAVSMLHYFMIFVINANQMCVNIAKNLGTTIFGLDGSVTEYDLYETALSKAYEISFVPGFIGLIMYLLLVYYTYKFVLVYANRLINVIYLFITAPIVFVVSTLKNIFKGIDDGSVRKWVKEFIFNVFIQTIHAFGYATCIGFFLKYTVKNENLILALLALIVYGFIFKIDKYIRVLFNIVDGSKRIRSTSNTSFQTSNDGGAADILDGETGHSKIKFGEAVKDFGKGVKRDGLGETVKSSLSGVGQNVQAKFKKIPEIASNYAKESASRIADVKDILNGEKVKETLTADEIVREYHNIKDRKGVEGLRQSVQSVGYSVVNGAKNLANIPKRKASELKYLYVKANRKTKEKVNEIQRTLKVRVQEVLNEYDIIKKLPKIIKKHQAKKEFIRTADGLKLDVSNMTMLVVDTDMNPQEIINEIKKQYGENIHASVGIFSEIGLQSFISSENGFPELGFEVLAESNYENYAERQMEEALTGNKLSRRVLKRPSRKKSLKATKKAATAVKSNRNIKKAYTFSRFSPNTVRRIRRQMLKKTINSNRYLVVLSRTYKDLQDGNIRVSGTIGNRRIRAQEIIRATRHVASKSVRQMNLEKSVAVSNYRKVANNSRRVEAANTVASTAMSANNTIRLGFKSIDKMTAGQIALRKMIQFGQAKEMPNDVVMVRKPEQEIKSAIQSAEPENVAEITISAEQPVTRRVKKDTKENANQEVEQYVANFEKQVIGQVQKASEEEKKALDEVIAVSALQAGETSLENLNYTENEQAKEIAIDQMVSSGMLTQEEAKNENIVEETIRVLNSRVEQLAESNSDLLLDTAMEIEYVKSVEERLEIGDFTVKDGYVTLEEKEQNFSDLLNKLAEQQVSRSSLVGDMLQEVVQDFGEDIKRTRLERLTPEQVAEQEAKEKAEKQYEKALQEAEKRWVKKYGESGEKEEKNVAEKIKKQGEENEVVQITFEFYGAVEQQGQRVSLTNRYSIKDFYDRVRKLDDADLYKTQRRFLQEYGEKIKKLQLPDFSFAKSPVEDMDGWSIYVVRRDEDIENGEKVRQIEVVNKEEKIADDVKGIIDKYFIDFKKLFTEFVNEFEISSFDDLHNDEWTLKEFVSRIRKMLKEKNEKYANYRKIASNIHKDIRFKNLLKDLVQDRLIQKVLQEKQEEVKGRYEKLKTREKAEQDAGTTADISEVEDEKDYDKSELLRQVMSEADKQIEQEALVSQEVRNVLDEIGKNKKLYMDFEESNPIKRS